MEKNKIIVVELKVIGWCFLIAGLTNIISPSILPSSPVRLDNWLAPLDVIAGISILKLQKRGRKFGIAACVIGIAIIVWAVLRFGRQNPAILGNICMSLPIFVFVTYLLCRNDIKEQFK